MLKQIEKYRKNRLNLVSLIKKKNKTKLQNELQKNTDRFRRYETRPQFLWATSRKNLLRHHGFPSCSSTTESDDSDKTDGEGNPGGKTIKHFRPVVLKRKKKPMWHTPPRKKKKKKMKKMKKTKSTIPGINENCITLKEWKQRKKCKSEKM